MTNELLRTGGLTEQLPGISLETDQEAVVRFTCRNSSSVWGFSLTADRLLRGVSLLGVENLQHFTLCDVTSSGLTGNTAHSSNNQECVMDSDQQEQEEGRKGTNEAENKTREEPEIKISRRTEEELEMENKKGKPRVYKYTMKLKFHTKIFGTFKQTIVFDFGKRPFLSKVTKDNATFTGKLNISAPVDGDRGRGAVLGDSGRPVGPRVDPLHLGCLGRDQLRPGAVPARPASSRGGRGRTAR